MDCADIKISATETPNANVNLAGTAQQGSSGSSEGEGGGSTGAVVAVVVRARA